jgi:hypothetical protein
LSVPNIICVNEINRELQETMIEKENTINTLQTNIIYNNKLNEKIEHIQLQIQHITNIANNNEL